MYASLSQVHQKWDYSCVAMQAIVIIFVLSKNRQNPNLQRADPARCQFVCEPVGPHDYTEHGVLTAELTTRRPARCQLEFFWFFIDNRIENDTCRENPF